ncbi:hypothetical protein ACFV3E_15125 [Streptomyces sp. NPDC059718]
MRLRLRHFRPHTGPVEHHVAQPWHPPRHTALTDPVAYGFPLGDHAGLSTPARLFSLAVRHSPRGGRAGLVLVRHSPGLRVSRWPRLCHRPTGRVPLTVRTDEARTALDAVAWWQPFGHADSHDRLRPVGHARTLFLVGGRGTFSFAAAQLAWAAGQGARQKGVVKGHVVLVAQFTPLPEPGDRRRGPELDVAFKAYPPCAHFRRPGRPRRRADAPSPPPAAAPPVGRP